MTSIHILHTNDFHNHLTEAQAAYIQDKKKSLRNVLLIDAGDAVSAGNIGVRPGGEPILKRMSAAGYDAMTLGNREFHVLDAAMRHKVADAKFPLLCANIRWRDNRCEPLPVVPNIITTTESGIIVGVFGLTVPMVTERMKARFISATVFDEPLNIARRQIEYMRSKVNLLIALTHLGKRADERLAEACPEIDLIVGGHSHSVLEEPQRAYGVPIVQGGWFGHYLGHVSIEMVSGQVIKIDSSLHDMRNVVST